MDKLRVGRNRESLGSKRIARSAPGSLFLTFVLDQNGILVGLVVVRGYYNTEYSLLLPDRTGKKAVRTGQMR